MWLVLGTGSIIFAVLNIIRTFQRKNARWFRFLSVSLTALTVCAFYADGAARVIEEDWGGLMDIMPAVSKALWVCAALSILINSISLFREKN